MAERFLDSCQYGHDDCFAYGCYAKCRALRETYFKDNVCPFYKTVHQRRHEHEVSINKLKAEGREDLIFKYGQDENQPRVWSDI